MILAEQYFSDTVEFCIRRKLEIFASSYDNEKDSSSDSSQREDDKNTDSKLDLEKWINSGGDVPDDIEDEACLTCLCM